MSEQSGRIFRATVWRDNFGCGQPSVNARTAQWAEFSVVLAGRFGAQSVCSTPAGELRICDGTFERAGGRCACLLSDESSPSCRSMEFAIKDSTILYVSKSSSFYAELSISFHEPVI